MLKITIDTNIILEEQSPTLSYLIRGHQEGWFDVAVASRFRMDKENDKDLERAQRHKKIASIFNNAPSTFLIGATYEDDDIGLLADEEKHSQLYCLFDINNETRGGRHSRYDIDHIYSHLAAKRDVFLTFEKRILNKRGVLKEVGVNVANPEVCINAIIHVSALHPFHSVEFHSNLFELLDNLHSPNINYTLMKRLQAMRKAQEDIRIGEFSKEDERAIVHLAMKHKAYRTQSPKTAIFLLKKRYHKMKLIYLLTYPCWPITTGNIVKGIKELYPMLFEQGSSGE